MSPTCPCCGGPVDPAKLELNHEERIVRRGGEIARVHPHPFAVLEALVATFPRLTRREAIFSKLYALRAGADEPDIRIVDTYVSRLRKDLRPMGLTILSVWGEGYRLVEVAGFGEAPLTISNGSSHAAAELKPSEKMRIAELAARGATVTYIARTVRKPYRVILDEIERGNAPRVLAATS